VQFASKEHIGLTVSSKTILPVIPKPIKLNPIIPNKVKNTIKKTLTSSLILPSLHLIINNNQQVLNFMYYFKNIIFYNHIYKTLKLKLNMAKIDETAAFRENKITTFFVKPHVNITEAQRIYDYLTKRLAKQKKYFEILFRARIWVKRDFWMEFYEHMKTKYPKELEEMAIQFENELWPTNFSLIKGDNIIQRVIDITGPTFYKDNPQDTIRGKWGPYEMPNTFVHASKHEEVADNIRVLNKYFHQYIPIHINLKGK